MERNKVTELLSDVAKQSRERSLRRASASIVARLEGKTLLEQLHFLFANILLNFATSCRGQLEILDQLEALQLELGTVREDLRALRVSVGTGGSLGR